MSAQKGLGRGLEALIPEDFDSSLLLDEHERIQKLPVSSLSPAAAQPRQVFDEAALIELAESLKTHGMLQPLVVTPAGAGAYHIIAGERRWRAAKLANLDSVPAIVRTLEKLQQLEIALVENVQRVDLSPLEQAVSLQRLHDQFSLTYTDIAKKLGKSPPYVRNLVRLTNLPPEALRALSEERISEGHARAILAIKDWPEQQPILLQNILEKSWSVRQAERFVAAVKAGISDEKVVKTRVAVETPETKQLGSKLGAPITIRRTARGGKLEIGFHSEDELKQIMHKLSNID